MHRIGNVSDRDGDRGGHRSAGEPVEKRGGEAAERNAEAARRND